MLKLMGKKLFTFLHSKILFFKVFPKNTGYNSQSAELTICLLVMSSVANYLCKQFGPSLGPTITRRASSGFKLFWNSEYFSILKKTF